MVQAVRTKKVVNIFVIGNSQVGKTALLRAIKGEPFNPSHLASMGMDVKNHEFNPNSNINDTVRAKLWDTSGQERFNALQ